MKQSQSQCVGQHACFTMGPHLSDIEITYWSDVSQKANIEINWTSSKISDLNVPMKSSFFLFLFLPYAKVQKVTVVHIPT